MKIVVVLSGGMDSTTLLYHALNLKHEVLALSFDYGQKHRKELDYARLTCKENNLSHKVVDLSALNELVASCLTRPDWQVPEGHYAAENMKATVVHNRNMVMLSLAVAYAIGQEAESVWYGAHSGDHTIYPDCRPDFLKAMINAALLCDWHPITIAAPFLNLSKGDIAKIGKDLGLDYSKTWTCYNGREKPCGKCGACVERKEALTEAGFTEKEIKLMS
ncbi:MAG: 7-cyano-7-deazaguanine synthase QueC [Prolixibacteraceae bacterium]